MIFQTILDQAQASLNNYLDKVQEHHEKEGFDFSSKDRQNLKLKMEYNFMVPLAKYIAEDDSLISANFTANSGSITASIKVEREGFECVVTVDQIIAGGLNIQKMHYRTISKTFPRNMKIVSKDKPELIKSLSASLKKLNKIQKLEGEIESFKKRLKEEKEKLDVMTSKPEQEIVNENPSSRLFLESLDSIKPNAPLAERVTTEEQVKEYNETLRHEILLTHEMRVRMVRESIQTLNLRIESNQKAMEKLS